MGPFLLHQQANLSCFLIENGLPLLGGCQISYFEMNQITNNSSIHLQIIIAILVNRYGWKTSMKVLFLLFLFFYHATLC